MLQTLPRVGPDKARRLLDTFGGFEAVCRASVADLIRVPGIGQGLARQIWAALHDADRRVGADEP